MDSLTDRSTLRALCEKHGFAFSRGLGQNFLVNPGICPKICDTADIGGSTNVLEIGPGFGTLTAQLAQRAGRVVALEVDTRLRPVLAETLAGYGNIQLVWGDVMETDLAALLATHFGGERASVCANLPYYITTPILMRLLESRLPIDSITVMVQKEAAQRITAAPGTRAAGAISYAIAYYTAPQLAFTVEPGSFYPPPKVKSAVIKLDVRSRLPLQSTPLREERLFRLVRGAFGQRRKTLANAVAAALGLPKPQTEQALQALGLSPLARAEQLTLEEYIRLEGALWPGQAQDEPPAK